MEYKVIGLNVIEYVGDVVYGHNCDFETVPEVLEKYEIFLKRLDRKGYA